MKFKTFFIFCICCVFLFFACNTEIVETGVVRISLSDSFNSSENSYPVTRGVLNNPSKVEDVIDLSKVDLKIVVRANGKEIVKKYKGRNYFSSPAVPPVGREAVEEILKEGISVPAGQNVDIEVHVINKESSYIAKAIGLDIEPYTVTDVELEFNEALPHLMFFTKSSGAYNFYPYVALDEPAVEEPFSGHEHSGFAFDSRGRCFVHENSSKIKHEKVGWIELSGAFCIDPKTNILYGFTGIDFKAYKILETESEGVDFSSTLQLTDSLGLVAEYDEHVLALSVEYGGGSPGSHHTTVFLNFIDKSTSERTKSIDLEFDNNKFQPVDMTVLGDKLYILIHGQGTERRFNPGSPGNFLYKDNNARTTGELRVYSLPNGNFLNTVASSLTLTDPTDHSGFFGPVKFIGKRGNLLYIADDGAYFEKSSVPAAVEEWSTTQVNRIAVYNTVTGSLNFVNAPENIKFENEYEVSY